MLSGNRLFLTIPFATVTLNNAKFAKTSDVILKSLSACTTTSFACVFTLTNKYLLEPSDLNILKAFSGAASTRLGEPQAVQLKCAEISISPLTAL